MCNQITVLAQDNTFRWIGVCEHGTISVSWDHLMLFLLPIELKKVSIVLDMAVMEREQAYEAHHLSSQQKHDLSPPLAPSASRYFELWIGQYAIRLSPADYLLLGTLIRKAATKFPPAILEQTTSVEVKIVAQFHDRAEVLDVPQISFSVN